MKKQQYNILVTGCGGDIGQSIGKILKSNTLFGKVYGVDLHMEHAGIFIFDECFVGKRVDDSQYVEFINKLIDKYQIDILLSASEPELRSFLVTRVHEQFTVSTVVMANDLSMDVGFDKLKTAQFLEQHQLPFPITTLASATTNPKFPCILKSRTGSGSKDLFIVKDEEELSFFTRKYPDFICQEFLPGVDSEYTCGLFRSNSDCRTIIFKRKLMGGFSGFGIVEENQKIKELLLLLAQKLNLQGSINVQLRIVNDTPYIFEINPRFSSTVRFRHLLGFEDVFWSIKSALNLPIDDFVDPPIGKRFYKGFSEYLG